MTPYEIKSVCITSAQKYYDYLLRNNKGLDKIQIRGIRRRSETEFILRLSKKIYDLDYVYLKFRDTAVDKQRYKFIEYDSESNQLMLSANGDFKELLKNATKNDIEELLIISDLKYLVKRVENWYQAYGTRLKFERNSSELAPEDSDYVSGQMSDEQRGAVSVIFSSGVSYIWGAPGTGKTRHVLSKALLTYIKSNCKILVAAPTNNALEQSLYGIIDVVKSEGIPKETILRLGTPSVEFAKENPECCVEQGLQKKIKELEKTVEQYKEKLEAISAIKNYELIEHEIIPKIHDLTELYEEYDNIIERFRISTIGKAKCEAEIAALNVKSNEHNATPNDEEARTTNRLKLLLPFKKRNKKEYDQNINRIDSELKLSRDIEEKMRKDLDNLNKECNAFEKDIRAITFDIANKRQTIEKLIETNGLINFRKEMQDKSITEKEQLDKTLLIIKSIMQEEEEPYRKKTRFLTENDTYDKLRAGYEQAQTTLGMMKHNTMGKRIEKANILAATIDCCISNFIFDSNENATAYSTPVSLSHIFLDEAAYCSMIKACTLFAAECPITFLGDHMQLPPVCEMNDSELKDEEKSKEVVLWSQSAAAVEQMFFNDIDHIYSTYINGTQAEFDHIQKADLTATYRFGSAISDILNRYVYKNGFRSARGEKTEIILCHVQCRYGSNSRENITEAKTIAEMVSRSDCEKESIVMLTPYKNQSLLIKKNLTRDSNKQNVMTVHASQGKEWDTVILSVTDTAKKWFTDSSNAMSKGLMVINTAVSRAKKRLIVVCDARYWINEKNQLIGSLINIADKRIKNK